jgi:hypothetical protein
MFESSCFLSLFPAQEAQQGKAKARQGKGSGRTAAQRQRQAGRTADRPLRRGRKGTPPIRRLQLGRTAGCGFALDLPQRGSGSEKRQPDSSPTRDTRCLTGFRDRRHVRGRDEGDGGIASPAPGGAAAAAPGCLGSARWLSCCLPSAASASGSATEQQQCAAGRIATAAAEG